jgi:hypothetical protein
VHVTAELQGVLKCSCVMRLEGVRGEGMLALSTALQFSVTVLLHFGGEEAFSTSPVIISSNTCSDIEFQHEIIFHNCNRSLPEHCTNVLFGCLTFNI